MNKLALLLLVVVAFAFGGWYFWRTYSHTIPTAQINTEIKEEPSEPVKATSTSIVTSAPGMQTYTNEEWGFRFEVPDDWQILEDSFRGSYTKLGMEMRIPADEVGYWNSAIVIHIVDPEFVYKSFGNTPYTEIVTKIDQIGGLRYVYDWNDIQQVAVVLPIQEYSIILGLEGPYPEVFEDFLDTFEFID